MLLSGFANLSDRSAVALNVVELSELTYAHGCIESRMSASLTKKEYFKQAHACSREYGRFRSNIYLKTKNTSGLETEQDSIKRISNMFKRVM